MEPASDMILVCGEALYDMFAAETNDGFTFQARAAGSPFNVAVGLARLGVNAALCTGLSNDFLGDKLASRLKEEGVALSHIQRLNAPTTTAFVSLADDGSATYAFYGEGAADRSLPVGAEVDLTGVEALHFGSYSFVVGTTADLYLSLMRRADGRFVSLDPNIRPTVEPDMAVWRDRLAKAAPLCDLIKLSDEDAGFLFQDTSLDDVAKKLLADGAGVVAITKGPDGAAIYTKDQRYAAPALAGPVVDTVGAGDSFQSAFLAGLSRLGGLQKGEHSELLWDQVLGYALQAAAKTCSRSGANPPYAEELNRD